MQLRSLIGKLQSPSFKAMAEMAQHAGDEMIVTRTESVRFPTGTVQVWEFTPYRKTDDRPPVVVAVSIKQKKLERWKPLDQDFEAAIAHYTRLADQTASPQPPPSNATALAVTLPKPPPGIRVVLPPRDRVPKQRPATTVGNGP